METAFQKEIIERLDLLKDIMKNYSKNPETQNPITDINPIPTVQATSKQFSFLDHLEDQNLNMILFLILTFLNSSQNLHWIKYSLVNRYFQSNLNHQKVTGQLI